MSELDLQTFMAGMTNLEQNFPDGIFTELKYEVWFEELSNQLSAEEFEIAIRKAVYKFRQCPTGEDLVSLVKASEKELVLECWSKALDALSRRLSLNELDMASQYAIAQLGGTNHLGVLPINSLQGMKFDFCTHWNSYRKAPKEFKAPSDPIPLEHREYTPPTGDKEPLSPEQKAFNAFLKSQLKNKMGIPKPNADLYQQIAKESQEQFKEELGDLSLVEMPF